MRVSTPELRPWLIRTALWAVALGVLWVLASSTYERMLASTVVRFLPDSTFVFLRAHTFYVGYGPPQPPGVPVLPFPTHNMGFGLVLAGAVALGAPGRSWVSRGVVLAVLWGALFVAQGWILVQAANLEVATVQGRLDPHSALVRLVPWTMHAIVNVLPAALAIVWLLLPPLGRRVRAPTHGRPGRRARDGRGRDRPQRAGVRRGERP